METSRWKSEGSAISVQDIANEGRLGAGGVARQGRCGLKGASGMESRQALVTGHVLAKGWVSMPHRTSMLEGHRKPSTVQTCFSGSRHGFSQNLLGAQDHMGADGAAPEEQTMSLEPLHHCLLLPQNAWSSRERTELIHASTPQTGKPVPRECSDLPEVTRQARPHSRVWRTLDCATLPTL